jgi:hypothetical protein
MHPPQKFMRAAWIARSFAPPGQAQQLELQDRHDDDQHEQRDGDGGGAPPWSCWKARWKT